MDKNLFTTKYTVDLNSNDQAQLKSTVLNDEESNRVKNYILN
jgi:hypothetical protein